MVSLKADCFFYINLLIILKWNCWHTFLASWAVVLKYFTSGLRGGYGGVILIEECLIKLNPGAILVLLLF